MKNIFFTNEYILLRIKIILDNNFPKILLSNVSISNVFDCRSITTCKRQHRKRALHVIGLRSFSTLENRGQR